MNAVPIIGFAVVAALAIAFAAVPLWRIENKKKRALFLAAAALSILAVGGGTYFFLGRPHLAQREAMGLISTGAADVFMTSPMARGRALFAIGRVQLEELA